MRKFIFSVIALISGGLFARTFADMSYDNLVLEKNDSVSMYSGHHSHCSHASHTSHAAHASHYSCTLSSADSMGIVSVNQLNIIKEGFETNPKLTVMSAFKAKSEANVGYDGRNGFRGNSIFVTLVEDIHDAQWTDCDFQVICMAIPLDKNIRKYYVYYEEFFSLDECKTYINKMGGEFRAIRKRSGYQADKFQWMYEL